MAGHGHARTSSCGFCGADIDRLLAPVRVIDGRVVSVCASCEHAPAPPVARDTARRDEPCEPIASALVVASSDRAARRRTLLAAGVGALALAVVAAQVGAGALSPAALSRSSATWRAGPRVAAATGAQPAEPHTDDARATAARAVIAQEADDELSDEELEQAFLAEEQLDESIELPATPEDMGEGTGVVLEEFLPTLADWSFPVQSSTEAFPLKISRRFGAKRTGVRPSWCGKGHCGVDLDGAIGTPVVAVAWGEVVRIRYDTDGRSGKYVKLQHPDFVYTSYMHLNTIADGLAIGDEVEPGQVIGTLGRTGIRLSKEHLHFSLEVPLGGKLRHIDPTPYLLRSRDKGQ